MSPAELLPTRPRTVTLGVTAIAVASVSLALAVFSSSSTTGNGVTWNVDTVDSSLAVRTRNANSPSGQSAAISNLHVSVLW